MAIFGHDTFSPTNTHIFNSSPTVSFHASSPVCGIDRAHEYVQDLVDKYLTEAQNFQMPTQNIAAQSEVMKISIQDFLTAAFASAMYTNYTVISHVIPIYGKDNAQASSNAQRFIDYMKVNNLTYHKKAPDWIIKSCPTSLTSSDVGAKGLESVYTWPEGMRWEEVYISDTQTTNPNNSSSVFPLESNNFCLVILANDGNAPQCEYCMENFALIPHGGSVECQCAEGYELSEEEGSDFRRCVPKAGEECEWYESLFGCGWYPTLWNVVKNVFKGG